MHDPLPGYAAVVFDLDGTLIDSYPAILASVNFVRHEHGLPPLDIVEVKQHVGRGMDYLLAHTLPDYSPSIDAPRYRQHHPTVMLQRTEFMPGAAEVLRVLRRAGKRLGLCSNKPRPFSVQLLRHLGLFDCFDVVVGPEDVAQPKPAPDMLRSAVVHLDLPPSALLYVGDMTVDIETARAAGVAVWVVPSGSDARAALEAARPDRLLNTLSDLLSAP
jgi:phosphoglycolate phosphatase